MLATPKDRLHGTLDALILKTLSWGPRHGYAITRWLRDSSGDAIQVEEGSLYPALYRMERQGWIEAEWGTSELGRKARFYRLTPRGPKAARGRDRAIRAVRRGGLAHSAAGLTRCRRSADSADSSRRCSGATVSPIEVDAELDFHLEMLTRELMEQGLDPRGGARAGAAALRRSRRRSTRALPKDRSQGASGRPGGPNTSPSCGRTPPTRCASCGGRPASPPSRCSP